MTATDLLGAFEQLGHPRILVLGDLILDRYTWGDAERVSQEAPVILLRAGQRESRLGGAANACNMLRGLDAHAALAGVVGCDADGQAVRALLQAEGIEADCVLEDKHRPTTVKERFIGRAANRHPYQMLRVDSEVRDPLAPELEQELARRVIDNLDQYQVLLVSDYGKGVCTPALLRIVLDAARQRGVKVLVDPLRGSDGSRYRGATGITPNRLETELLTGVKITTIDDAFEAGRALCRLYDITWAIVTLDRDGIVLVESNGRGQHFPTRPREVYDITGAGDMVLATLGLCVACGVTIEDAIRLANIAGGLEVEKVGVVPISRAEIRSDLAAASRRGAPKLVDASTLAGLVEARRAQGARIVFTNGCFDLLHVGHVTYLAEAAAQGDVLVVGVNSDESVRTLKGPTRPVIKQQDRAAMLAALACVDYVTIFDDLTPVRLIEQIRPDVLVKGGDYRGRLEEIAGREVVESYGGRLHLTGMVDGVSTTRILRSVAA